MEQVPKRHKPNDTILCLPIDVWVIIMSFLDSIYVMRLLRTASIFRDVNWVSRGLFIKASIDINKYSDIDTYIYGQLRELKLENIYDSSLHINLPPKLTHLTLEGEYNQPLAGALPTSLTHSPYERFKKVSNTNIIVTPII